MKKLWDKGKKMPDEIEKFITGNDPLYDNMIAEWDIIASFAHISMLNSEGLITDDEYIVLKSALEKLLISSEKKEIILNREVEDIHTFIELELTRIAGSAGMKVHAGRSRNDQVMVATRLYSRENMKSVASAVTSLANTLLVKAKESSKIFMPGYTHMQVAMLSSFGLWFGSWAESLADDLFLLKAAWDINNRNPLGTAAGYGSDMPVNRETTTTLLKFDGMNVVSPYTQISKGKVERIIATSISSIAYTMSRMSADIILFLGQNYKFFELPDSMTTGSSIMPQKKNPDVVEMIRARCNRLQSVPNEITLLINNLPSGYHRDSQLLKEILFPTFSDIISCLNISELVIKELKVNPDLLKNPIYNSTLAINEVNSMVKKGDTFREAYRKVADSLTNSSNFRIPDCSEFVHTGSIGNPGLELVSARIQDLSAHFSSPGSRDLFENISALGLHHNED